MADQQIIDKANNWLSSNIDESSKKEISSMLSSADDTALVEAFYKDLEFGTGGLRWHHGCGVQPYQQVYHWHGYSGSCQLPHQNLS